MGKSTFSDTLRKMFADLKQGLGFTFFFLLLLWAIMSLKAFLELDLRWMALLPRDLHGLLGIITSPLVHADFDHLIGNSSALIVLIPMLFLFYGKKSFFLLGYIWVLGGAFLWIIGRDAYVIGASGVVYGIASFLLFSGIFTRKPKLIIPSIIIVLYYSGLVWGILPTESYISWEGHLSGAIAGAFVAYQFRKEIKK